MLLCNYGILKIKKCIRLLVLGGFFVLLQKMRWTMGLVSVSHENRHHRIVWMKHKEIICGMLSAICYGTNPFGALPLYEEGVNTASVLFYRFSVAVVILFVMLMMGRQSMRVQKNEIKVLASLGILMAIASITFYQSFHYMDAGIASTILFVYPVMVAVIMSVFFKEKYNPIHHIGNYSGTSGCRHVVSWWRNSDFKYIGSRTCHTIVPNHCCLYRSGQPVEHSDVIVKTDFLCVADMCDVSASLFLHLVRVTSPVASITEGMVLCRLVGIGTDSALFGIHDYCHS